MLQVSLVGEQGQGGGLVSNYCVLVSFHGSTKKKLLYNLRKNLDNEFFSWISSHCPWPSDVLKFHDLIRCILMAT